MIKKHTVALLACATLSATAPTSTKAQGITFEIEAFKMEPGTANFFEKRLLEGGDGALQAELKLPELIEEGTIRRISQLEFEALNNVRHKSDAGGKRLEVPEGIEFVDGSLAEGLTIETENAVGPGGIVSFIYTLTYVELAQREILIREARNVVPLEPGRRTFLHRFRYTGNSVLLLTAVQKSSNPNPTTKPRENANAQADIHVVAKLYRLPNVKVRDTILKAAETDPELALKGLLKEGNVVESFSSHCRAGQRNRLQHYTLRVEDGESFDDGSDLATAFTTVPGGETIELSGEFSLQKKNGRSARGTNGGRISQREVIESQLKKSVTSGTTYLFPCTTKVIPQDGKPAEPASYIFALQSTAYGLADTQP